MDIYVTATASIRKNMLRWCIHDWLGSHLFTLLARWLRNHRYRIVERSGIGMFFVLIEKHSRAHRRWRGMNDRASLPESLDSLVWEFLKFLTRFKHAWTPWLSFEIQRLLHISWLSYTNIGRIHGSTIWVLVFAHELSRRLVQHYLRQLDWRTRRKLLLLDCL